MLKLIQKLKRRIRVIMKALEVYKMMKALEIIKRNQDVIYVYTKYDEEWYTKEEIEDLGGQKYYLADGSDQYIKHEITKEEYDLLKEVML